MGGIEWSKRDEIILCVCYYGNWYFNNFSISSSLLIYSLTYISPNPNIVCWRISSSFSNVKKNCWSFFGLVWFGLSRIILFTVNEGIIFFSLNPCVNSLLLTYIQSVLFFFFILVSLIFPIFCRSLYLLNINAVLQ